MLNKLREIFPERSPARLAYHRYSAILAALWYRFPGNKLTVIGVTGTSGKSTTVELIHYLLQNSGVKTGSISGIQFNIGDKSMHNGTLRTSLRPWHTQKLLRQMVRAECEFAVIEISSHALDQNRLWGVAVDTAVLTNIFNNEHLDYHGSFAEYVRAKTKLFKMLNLTYRKPGVPKVSILNRDDDNFEVFQELPADKRWSYSLKKPSEVRAENLVLTPQGTEFTVRLPNHNLKIKTPIVGRHNIMNLQAAVATVAANGVTVKKIEELLVDFPGIPGRLEPINAGQNFSVVVDFSYKPSGLQAVLKTLHEMASGRVICVWGGLGGRKLDEPYYAEAVRIIEQNADEFVLTTDDPLDDNPKAIAKLIRSNMKREEGDNFYEIEDRYEAIRYAVYIAEPGDCVIIAGRGHEKEQTIGARKIPFDDRVIAREILQFALETPAQ
jgi:UDP-N-acetylmuramoyl-L-alanyl-D-glutamate--2,6-diaminopimelate ligase